MVEFGTGYFTAMDREYTSNVDSSTTTTPEQQTNDIGINAGDLGMSLGLGPVPNVPAVQAKMRAGSKKMELDFMGFGKGSGQGHTPGMYGKKQRQALRESAKANRVDFTTHSSVGVFGLAGQDRQGNFTREAKEASVQEIKRAIEFAADVAEGGPVVVHTGEFQRPIKDASWNGGGNFEAYPGEDERASYKVVDTRTGALVSEAKKGRTVAKPVWNRYNEKNSELWGDKDGKSYVDENGQTVNPRDYVDYYGNKISRAERVPVYNKKDSMFEVHQVGWEDFIDEAREMTTEAKETWQKWRNGQMSDEDIDKSMWRRFLKKGVTQQDIKVKPEEAYILATLETNAAHSKGWAYSYSRGFEDDVKYIKKLNQAKEAYKKTEDETDPEKRWQLKRQADQLAMGLVRTDTKFPSEIIDREIKMREASMKQAKEAAASQWAQAMENEETMRNVQSAEGYALEESYDSYARAGMHALAKSKELKKRGKLKKQIFVAMENLFPETYGSHPNEIINLIEGSRKKMTKLLVENQGYQESEAKRLAEQSLKVTFDTGHLNMWRKYWKGDSNKTPEQNDKDFDKWMINTVDRLAGKNMIGHLHLVDNYGYQDEHLAPGEGNTPIKAILKVLKKNKFDGDVILEPGADYTTDNHGFNTVIKTWKHLGSNAYSMGSGGGGVTPQQRSWGQIHYQHFGQNQPPYFTFPPYSPSEDWTLWSGVQLE